MTDDARTEELLRRFFDDEIAAEKRRLAVHTPSMARTRRKVPRRADTAAVAAASLAFMWGTAFFNGGRPVEMKGAAILGEEFAAIAEAKGLLIPFHLIYGEIHKTEDNR